MTVTDSNSRAVWALRIREERGSVPQDTWAARVGVSTATVSRWERGKHRPGYEQAKLLAAATGKPASFFLDDDEEEAERHRAFIDAAVEEWKALIHDGIQARASRAMEVA